MTQTESAIEKSGTRPGLTLAAVAVVQFMVSLDLSVVNVGLPQIAAGLGFSAVGLTWVIHAYALAFGGLLLLGGKIADRYGRKRVLVLGLTLFGLASLVGGFAQVPGHLVAARARRRLANRPRAVSGTRREGVPQHPLGRSRDLALPGVRGEAGPRAAGCSPVRGTPQVGQAVL